MCRPREKRRMVETCTTEAGKRREIKTGGGGTKSEKGAVRLSGKGDGETFRIFTAACTVQLHDMAFLGLSVSSYQPTTSTFKSLCTSRGKQKLLTYCSTRIYPANYLCEYIYDMRSEIRLTEPRHQPVWKGFLVTDIQRISVGQIFYLAERSSFLSLCASLSRPSFIFLYFFLSFRIVLSSTSQLPPSKFLLVHHSLASSHLNICTITSAVGITSLKKAVFTYIFHLPCPSSFLPSLPNVPEAPRLQQFIELGIQTWAWRVI
jgi:hypothetical protein